MYLPRVYSYIYVAFVELDMWWDGKETWIRIGKGWRIHSPWCSKYLSREGFWQGGGDGLFFFCWLVRVLLGLFIMWLERCVRSES